MILEKKPHMDELLKRFNLIGHTLGFYPQTQKVEPPCIA